MNFALILLVLTVISGLIYLLDACFWSKKRAPEINQPKWIEHARSFFPVLLVVLFLRSFLVEPFRIPSGSLEPTLLVGDFLVVNKFSYGIRLPVVEKKIIPVSSPKVGEIAVFRWPPNPTYDYIKRVVGAPGDTVAYRNKKLFVNGQEMPQTFVKHTVDESSGKTVAMYRESLNGVEHDIYINPRVPAFDFEVTVPENQYFMMGDNRDDSADSRFWGFVSDDYLRGKALLVWMSWDGKTGMIRWPRLGGMIK